MSYICFFPCSESFPDLENSKTLDQPHQYIESLIQVAEDGSILEALLYTDLEISSSDCQSTLSMKVDSV